jgi:hypothetical protein
MHQRSPVWLLFGLLITGAPLAGCQSRPDARQAQTQAAAKTSWDRHVNHFLEEYFQYRPEVAVNAGRHEYDGRLPDWSRAGLERYTQFLKTQRAAAEKQNVHDAKEELEREYMLAAIDGELFWIETAQAPFTNPMYYAGFGGVDPNVYLTREYAPLDVRLRAFTRYLQNLPAALHQIRANLRTPMPQTFVNIGRTTFGGLVTFFEGDVPKIFAPVTDQRWQQPFQAARADAIRELKALDHWLEEQSATATDQFALGPERFEQMLWETERVRISLDELEKIARADLERNIAALKAACEKLAPGKPISEALALVKARKPADGPVSAARRQLTGLKQFLGAKDLVTIPGPEEALVDESPAYMRWNSAYINIPGPYEKNLPSTYYIAPPEPTWTPQEQLEYIPGEPDLLFTSVHEVWPGHFLQYLHANRSPSQFGQIFVGYAFAEGWAHYTEEMMWEAGLGEGDPAVHIGQLLNALLRNARFLSAIGLHRGTMTVEESERLFREQGFQDAATARQQAARGTFDPAYLNYTMGKLMVRKLRDDWCATRGGRAAWKQFHDQFLAFGGPPIPLVRKAMMGDSGSLF